MPQDYAEFRAHWPVVVSAAIGVGVGVTGAMVYSLGIMLNPLADAFGWSRAEISAAKTFLTLGFAVTAPFVGYVADKFGVRKIALISLILLSLALVGMTRMNGSILIFYASIFGLSLVGCCTTPLVWTRAVATWFEKRRGLALGVTLAGTGIAGILAPLVLDGLIERYGWQAGYLAMAAAAALAVLPAYFWFFEQGRQDEKAENSIRGPASPALEAGLTVKEAFRTFRFWQFAFAFMLIGGIISALAIHLVPMLTDANMPRAMAVRMIGAMGAAVILGRVTTGFLVDRFHPPYVAAVFLSMPIIGCLLLGTDAPALWLAVTAAIFIGLAAGSEVDLLPYLTARYFGLKSYGRLYGWVFIFFYVGVGIAPPAFGRVFDLYGNYDSALSVAVGALGLGVLCIATLGKAPKF